MLDKIQVIYRVSLIEWSIVTTRLCVTRDVARCDVKVAWKKQKVTCCISHFSLSFFNFNIHPRSNSREKEEEAIYYSTYLMIIFHSSWITIIDSNYLLPKKNISSKIILNERNLDEGKN